MPGPRPSIGILSRNASTSLAQREVLSPRRDRPGPGRPKGIIQVRGEDGEAEHAALLRSFARYSSAYSMKCSEPSRGWPKEMQPLRRRMNSSRRRANSVSPSMVT